MEQVYIFLEVIGAGILGAVVGYEREVAKKPAGLRTYIIIASVSCLFVNLGSVLVESYAQGKPQQLTQSDPIRIFEAIIVGISFIGGGLIIKYKESGDVANLTTAALILFTAAIGICVSLNQYLLAISLTGVSLLISSLLGKRERSIVG